MTTYELTRLLAEPLLPYFNRKVRDDVRGLARPGQRIVDVGGRRSPYTVGLPIEITVVDLPRDNESQTQYGLGITTEILAGLRRRRSNIVDIKLEDMTRCSLPSRAFDGVISIEVIEHVVDDAAFVAQIARVLRPGGWAYLTTPNGDYMPVPEGDHKRHYARAQLRALLDNHFEDVQIVYGVATGKNRIMGLKPYTLRNPVQTVRAITANLRHRRESRGLEERVKKTANLFAIARNPR
jgi:SAM-dependent methyltransferase